MTNAMVLRLASPAQLARYLAEARDRVLVAALAYAESRTETELGRLERAAFALGAVQRALREGSR